MFLLFFNLRRNKMKKENNLNTIIVLWDEETWCDDAHYVIEYDEQEFAEEIKKEYDEEDCEHPMDMYHICGSFSAATHPFSSDDSTCVKRTWSIHRLLAHAKATGLQPDYQE